MNGNANAPALHPTVVLAVGPTAAAILARTEMRVRGQLGGFPPFFAFLSCCRQPGPPLAGELRVGEEEPESLSSSAAASDGEELARWLRLAAARATEVARNLNHSVFRGCRNQFERADIIVVAVLEEVSDFAWLIEPLRRLYRDWPHCRRLGVFWTELLAETDEAGRARREETTAMNLSALDVAQLGVNDRDEQAVFQTCWLMSAPGGPGLRTLRPVDVVDLTGAFLGYALASAFGTAVDPFIEPRPDPARFHFGLTALHYDSAELVEALSRRWLADSATLLTAPMAEEPVSQTDFAPLTVKVRLGDSREAADQAVESVMRAVWLDAAGAPTKGSVEQPSAAWRVESALPRIEAVLYCHLQTVHRLHNEWQRQREDSHKAYERWKLLDAPPEMLMHDDVEEAREFRWAVALTLFVPLVLFALPSVFPLWAPLAASVLALTVCALAGPKRTQRSRQASRPNPEYERYFQRGAELRRQLALATHMVGAPETAEEGPDLAQDPPMRGLWRVAWELGERHRTVRLLTDELRARIVAGQDTGGWFVRNIVSGRDLEALYRHALAESAAMTNLAGSPAQPPATESLVAAGLRGVFASEGLPLLLARGHEALLRHLVKFGADTFSAYGQLSLADTLRWVDRDQPGECKGAAALLNALSRSAVPLWRVQPEDLQAEAAHLLHSPDWDSGLSRASLESLGRCQTSTLRGQTELALVRVLRGRSWSRATTATQPPPARP
jgi:hypothetical protein